MTIATLSSAPSARLGDLLARVAPKRPGRDPLGIAAGFRAHRLYSELAARSDADLARMGLKRTDIAQVVFDTVFGDRQAA